MKRFVLLVAATLGLASACEVPVFRFALERWPADPLPVEVTADASVGPEGVTALKWLQNQMPGEVPANLSVRLIDPDGPSDIRGSFRLLPAGTRPNAADPHVLWEGSLSEVHAKRLSGSPARESIARQLLEGTSAVWVVVSRGDTVADARAVKLVTAGINRAMQQLTLPTGVIHCDEAAQRLSENPQATMDDVLRTKIPLRIAFTVLLVRANDPEEDLFREVVANLAPPDSAPGEPLVAPIFGRGRILSPAPLSKIDEDRVFEGCSYLSGACACMVKQQNPGIDLPFRVDWDSQIKTQVVSIDSSINLPGPETVTYGTPAKPTVPAAAVTTGSPATPRRLLLLAAVAVLLMGLGLLLARKKRKPAERG